MQIIHLPLSALVLLVIGLSVAMLLAFRVLRTAPSKQSSDESDGERDWSVPAIDSHAHLDSPFHRWDPRIKVVALLVYIFCVASLRQPLPAGIALVLGVAAVLVAGIPMRLPAKRLAAMGSFLGMFLVVMPLTASTQPGDAFVVFDRLDFVHLNLRGFFLAFVICLKASAIALMMDPLLGTSTLSVTMQALARLGMPGQVCQMILLAHRYIFVFHHEVERMTTGMEVRGFRKKTSLETLRTLGNFLGMLLVRSFERTQRVYEAMLCRGYRGALPGDVAFSACRSDWLKGAFWIMVGIALFGIDRLGPASTFFAVMGFWNF